MSLFKACLIVVVFCLHCCLGNIEIDWNKIKIDKGSNGKEMFDVSGVLLQPAFQNSVLGAIQDKLKIEDPEEMDAVGRAFKASLLKVQKEGVNLDKARSARKKLDEEDDDFK